MLWKSKLSSKKADHFVGVKRDFDFDKDHWIDVLDKIQRFAPKCAQVQLLSNAIEDAQAQLTATPPSNSIEINASLRQVGAQVFCEGKRLRRDFSQRYGVLLQPAVREYWNSVDKGIGELHASLNRSECTWQDMGASCLKVMQEIAFFHTRCQCSLDPFPVINLVDSQFVNRMKFEILL